MKSELQAALLCRRALVINLTAFFGFKPGLPCAVLARTPIIPCVHKRTNRNKALLLVLVQHEVANRIYTIVLPRRLVVSTRSLRIRVEFTKVMILAAVRDLGLPTCTSMLHSAEVVQR